MQFKYNPGFYSDEEIMTSFVARKEILSILLETIRENTGSSNQHFLLVGPRGIGKTTLARRVAAEIRSTEPLNTLWFPVQFAEESYQVATPGEFWLEALARLGDQEKQLGLSKAVQDFRSERDEVRLRERAFGEIVDYARRVKKRVLLIVE